MRLILAFLALFLPAVAIAAPGQSSGPVTQESVTCGATSGAFLGANAAAHFIAVIAPTTGGIWVNWADATAATAPPAEHIVAGAVKVWDAYLPTSASTCISDNGGSVTVTVELN